MILSDIHTHTTYCDGGSTPEDMLISAINKGFKTYGFSSHSHLKYDESWNMSFEAQEKYVNEVLSLREKYKDKIEVLLGTEYDLLSDNDLSKFDYVIGSCHSIIKDGNYLSVDHSEKVYLECVNDFYGGDHYAIIKDYYELMATAVENEKITVYGHFDLINKFNKNLKHFDENDIRYKEPMLKALEALAKSGIPFELNTSATYRHSEKEPTLSAELWLKALAEMGGSIVLTSDAHSPERIGYNFERAETFAKKCGFKNIHVLTANGLEIL